MSLKVLEEMNLRLLEQRLIERSKELEDKNSKTLIDYAEYLEVVKSCRDIQEQIFDIKSLREKISEDQCINLISEYQKLPNMPCKELFFIEK